jgi:uncharacterized membrane protein
MTSRSRSGNPRKRFYCQLCDKKVAVPKDWGIGAAVRRHYWRYHRAVMMAGTRKAGRGR